MLVACVRNLLRSSQRVLLLAPLVSMNILALLWKFGQMQKICPKTITRRSFIGTSVGAAGGILLSSCSDTTSNDCENQARQTLLSRTQIYTEGENRVFESNGVPDHATGVFPSPSNPYAVGDRDFRFEVPLNPVKNPDGPIPISFWRFGIALNGVTFDPAGPSLVEGWQFEVMSFTASKHLGIDGSNAHVQPYDFPGAPALATGQYHYHGFPIALYLQLFRQATEQGLQKDMLLLGFAADGFPIYAPSAPADSQSIYSIEKTVHSSYRLKPGLRTSEDSNAPTGEYDGTFVEDYEFVAGLGDLDECNGRDGITPEYPEGIYHYFITQEFPFVPRLFKGQPADPSFNHPVGPGPGQTPPALAGYHS